MLQDESFQEPLESFLNLSIDVGEVNISLQKFLQKDSDCWKSLLSFSGKKLRIEESFLEPLESILNLTVDLAEALLATPENLLLLKGLKVWQQTDAEKAKSYNNASIFLIDSQTRRHFIN